MTRPFNPSNKPGTCLWCGRKLRPSYRAETVGTGKWRRPKACSGCGAEGDVFDKTALPGHYVCRACSTNLFGIQRRRLVGRREIAPAPEFFDTNTCARAFAESAARDGIRMHMSRRIARKLLDGLSYQARQALGQVVDLTETQVSDDIERVEGGKAWALLTEGLDRCRSETERVAWRAYVEALQSCVKE